MTGRRGAPDGFDRIKPPEQRLLDRRSGPRLDAKGTDAEGRAALFTNGPERDRQRERRAGAPARSAAGARGRAGEDARSRAGEGAGSRAGEGAGSRAGEGAGRDTAAPGPRVHCSRCDATTRLDAATALRAALPLFLVHPWRDHPLFAMCPACRRRAWLRIDT